MKKVLLLALLCTLSFISFSQSVQPRSSSVITVQDSRWMGQYNMFIPRYADTTAANVQKGIDSCGAQIFTYDWGLWYRGCSPKRWIQIYPGFNPGTDTLAWSVRGNDVTNLITQPFLGTTSNNPLRITTNNVLRLRIPESGIVRDYNDPVNRFLLYDTVTKNMAYSEGVPIYALQPVNILDSSDGNPYIRVDTTNATYGLATQYDLTLIGGSQSWQDVMDVGNTTTTDGVLNAAKFTFNPSSGTEEFLKMTRPTPYTGGMDFSIRYGDNVANGDGSYNSPMYWGFNVGGTQDPAYGGNGFSLEPDYSPSPPTKLRELHYTTWHPGSGVSTRLMSSTYTQGSTAANSDNLWYFKGSSFQARTISVDNAYFSAGADNGVQLYNPTVSTSDYLQLKYTGGTYGSSYSEIGFNESGTAHQHAGIHLDTRTAVAPIRFFVAASGTAAFDAMDIFQDGSVQIGSLNTQIASTRLYAKGLGATSGTYAFKTQNSSSTDLFGVRNDGAIAIGGSVGTSGQVLTSGGAGAATWGSAGVTTMAAIGSSPNANGASISGSTLTLQPADGSFGGVLTTAAQTIAGFKTFNDGIGEYTEDNIDLSGGDFTVTKPGIYVVLLADLTNGLILPDPSLMYGSTITVINGDGGGDPVLFNGSYIVNSPAVGAVTVAAQSSLTAKAILFLGTPLWVATASYP